MMKYEQIMRDKQIKRKAARLGILVGAVFLILLIVLELVPAGSRKNYRLDESAIDGSYVLPSFHADGVESEPSEFRFQINSNPTAENGSDRIPFFIGNPEENEQNIQVVIRLEESGEILYISPVIVPGKREVYGALNVALGPGDYPATAVFITFDEETGEEKGRVEAGILLTITE